MATTPQTPPTVPDVATAPDPQLPSYQFDPIAWAFTLSLSPFKAGMDSVAANVYYNSNSAYTSASEAATSASGASNSASNAAASASLAQSWASSTSVVSGGLYGARKYAQDAAALVGQYKGSLTSDPVSAIAGDWYISSLTGYIRAYNGAAWVQGISATAGVSSVNGQTGSVTVDQINDSVLSLTATWSSAKIAADRQATLVSGTNIKTVNGQSLLGNGNLIVSSGTGEDGSAFLPSLIKQTANSIVPTSLSGPNNYLCSVIELDTDRTFLMIGKDSGLWGVIHSSSTGFGTPVLIRSGNIVNNARATQHSATEILVVSCPTSSTIVQAVILTVTSSTIVVNTYASATSGITTSTSGFGRVDDGNYGIVKVGSTYCVARFVYGSTPEITAVTVSGTTCAIGFTTVAGVTANVCPVLYESGGYLFVFVPRGLNGYPYYTTYSASGTTLTVVTPTTNFGNYSNSAIAKMQSNTFLLVYGANGSTVHAQTLTIGAGGAATVSSSVIALATNGISDPQPCVIRLSDTKAAVCGNYPSANIITVGANSCVAGTQIDLQGGSNAVYALGVKNGIAYFVSDTAVVRVSDNAGQPRASNEKLYFSPTGYSKSGTGYTFDRPSPLILVGTTYLTGTDTTENLILAVSENYVGLAPNNARNNPLYVYPNQNNTSVWYVTPSSQSTTRLTRLTIA